jgi:predicted protein tyrosine phosphatase
VSLQKRNVLFICSRNQWRSPTAESLYRKHPQLNVRSAGTSPQARRKVSENDIVWAHIVFVMENQHRRQLRSRFGDILESKRVVNLDIPDEYRFMDPELVELLHDGVERALAEFGG